MFCEDKKKYPLSFTNVNQHGKITNALYKQDTPAHYQNLLLKILKNSQRT